MKKIIIYNVIWLLSLLLILCILDYIYVHLPDLYKNYIESIEILIFFYPLGILLLLAKAAKKISHFHLAMMMIYSIVFQYAAGILTIFLWGIWFHFSIGGKL